MFVSMFEQMLYFAFVGSGYSNTTQNQGTGECNCGKYS